MMAFIGDHLWQSTLVAAAGALLAAALRSTRADVRYWIWLAASVKFLIPFAALTAAGAAVVPQWTPPVAGQQVTAVIDTAAQALSVPALLPSTSVAPSAPLDASGGARAASLLALWAAGTLCVLGTWFARWRRVRAIVRRGTIVRSGREAALLRELGARLPLVCADSALEPGVFGIRRPVLVWPRAMSARLTDEQISAIFSHELAHAERSDNLTAALHLVVQALFWFHPVVWWIGGRLLHERERACDEAVLRSGRAPHSYAEGILRTCEYVVESPLPCISGVTGADLARRIEAIMRGRPAAAPGPAARTLLLSAGAALVVAPMAFGSLDARPLGAPQAASRSASPEDPLAFEVAAVRPNKTGDGRVMLGIQPGGRFTATNVTVEELIRTAYGLRFPGQLDGGPGWIRSERFDVIAKAPEGALIPGRDAISAMLRALLAERFKLATRTEAREMATYDLVLARGDGRLGERLVQSTRDCSPASRGARAGGAPPAPGAPGSAPACGVFMALGRISAGGVPMAQVATELSRRVDRFVTDKTGLPGSWEFELEFTPDQRPGVARGTLPPGVEPPPADAPSLFTALQEQLGLKLEPSRGAVDIVVITAVERPEID